MEAVRAFFQAILDFFEDLFFGKKKKGVENKPETTDRIDGPITIVVEPDPETEIEIFGFQHNPLDNLFYTQKFNEDPELYSRWNLKGHHGVDFRTAAPGNPEGHQNCYAVLDGHVLEARENDNNGKYVRLSHSEGAQSVYLHLSSILVNEGQMVAAGHKIGVTGNTGFSGGPHLHFGYRPPNFNAHNGYMGYINPEPYFLT